MLTSTNELEKLIWTDADFDRIGWLEVVVWAMAFFPDSYELAFDVDHPVKWIPPADGVGYYEQWIAPATLVFRNVYELDLGADLFHSNRLDDLHRDDPRVPPNADYIAEKTDWHWALDFTTGEISFRSTGFHEYFRRQPLQRDRLSLDERGGLSFERSLR